MKGQVFLWLMLLLYPVEVGGICQDGNDTEEWCSSMCQCRHNDDGGITVDCGGKGSPAVPYLPLATTVVELNDNYIRTISPEDFSNCTRLRTINLANNDISSIDPMSFQDNPDLEILYLPVNPMNPSEGSPPGLFDALYNLTELQLHVKWYRLGNNSYLEDLLQNKPRLKTLTIHISGGPLPPIFSRLVSLQFLQINIVSSPSSSSSFVTFSELDSISVREIVIQCEDSCSINIKALSSVTSLTTLDIRSYDMTEGIVISDWSNLKYTNIRKLTVYGLKHGVHDVISLFESLHETNITELHLDASVVGQFCVQMNPPYTCPISFWNITRLEKLSITMTSLEATFEDMLSVFGEIPNLIHLDISQLKSSPLLDASYMYNKCRELYLPLKLVTLNMSNVISSLVDLGCVKFYFNLPGRMDHIDMSHNKFTTLKLRISGYSLQDPANHVVNITHIDLASCNIKNIEPIVSDKPVYIQSMDLSFNHLGKYLSSDHDAAFSSYMESVHLREVNLSNNVITNLPEQIFKNSISLRKLDLSKNDMTSWQMPLAPLENITFLDLSNNILSFLDVKTSNELTKIAAHHLVSINLAGNPLQCQCYTLHFLKWLHQARHTNAESREGIYVMDMDSYSCTQVDGSPGNFSNLTNIIKTMELSCASKEWVTVTGITLGLLLLVIILFAAIYRNRWDIRYAWLRLTRQRKEDQEQNSERQHKYDAFVAYHQDDLTWIVQVLVPRLETGPDPLRLCIHHRNWLPGPTIEENISRSVEVSRKTLVILTNNFLRSGWCDFEIQLARMRGLDEGTEVTVVVALEEIPMRKMSTTLSNLRRTNTWLDWYEYENDRQQFWELLSEALGAPRVLRNHTRDQGEGCDGDIFLIT